MDKKQRRGNGHVRPAPPTVPIWEDGIWRTCNVLWATQWSHTTLYERIRKGLWPRPTKEGSINGWHTAVCRQAFRRLGYPQTEMRSQGSGAGYAQCELRRRRGQRT
ncbi:MAG TPA: hypothetical protein VFV84_07655, partial [Burkholderiales bacterium]|nr:hypothetical protein [Burkholderiales bacterium]